MADPNLLFEIPLYKIGSSNNWSACQVVAQDDESFYILGGRGERKVFRDEELQANEEGKYKIDISYLDLKFFLPNVDLPTEIEVPLNVLEARKEKRKENEIRRGSVFCQDYKEKRLFYYIEGEKLIIKLFGIDEAGKMITEPEKETTADKIEIIHNRKAVNVKKLKLGHPYLELPGEVAPMFENVLQAAELRKLALVPGGISMLNGLPYYKLNTDIPAGMWVKVQNCFEDFGQEGTMQGMLTCEPGKVADVLRIPIKEGL